VTFQSEAAAHRNGAGSEAIGLRFHGASLNRRTVEIISVREDDRTRIDFVKGPVTLPVPLNV
jgi:hypothetical protein